jgi:GT2 family glycosyltransferase
LEEKNLVVIIILNYNKKEDTLLCLKSVANLEYSPFEVVLVDNGSVDGSKQEIKKRFPGIHLIESKKNLGASGGRNLAINYVSQNFNYRSLLFLDNDTTIKKNALTEMINAFGSKKNIGIVSPKCYVTNNPGVIKYAGGLSINYFLGSIDDIGGGEKDEGQFEEAKFIAACGGLFLVSKEVINKVKKFDEKFNPYGWEDVDFSLRVRKLGYKILYNPKAIVYHKGGKIGRRSAIPEYEYSKVKNYFYLFGKHATIFQLIVISMVLPLKAFLILTKEIFNGEFYIIFSQLRGFLKLFKNKF